MMLLVAGYLDLFVQRLCRNFAIQPIDHNIIGRISGIFPSTLIKARGSASFLGAEVVKGFKLESRI